MNRMKTAGLMLIGVIALLGIVAFLAKGLFFAIVVAVFAYVVCFGIYCVGASIFGWGE